MGMQSLDGLGSWEFLAGGETRSIGEEIDADHQPKSAHFAQNAREFFLKRFSLDFRTPPNSRAFSARRSRRTISRIFSATAQPSGVPPNVLACVPADRTCANSSLTQNAPIGNPPPNDFAIETASGKHSRSPTIVCHD